MKTSAQIRQEFLDYFKKKQHVITPSAPVVPRNDPTLLFTNAGMNQFKPVFLGDVETYEQDGKQWKRAANSQKCIRVSGKHNDLEEVGHDTYHHTLFEMLGNWSFGDYFKKEAIGWAWELLVKEWGLDPDRLYATVFGGDEQDGLDADEEAVELWKSETNISHDHILRCSKKDNFWEMGETGPCGPCSEIHIDLRTDEERKKSDGASLVNADDPRVMEIWNLVFIQFNRMEGGLLKPLPAKHVDTGMGFERICAVLQNKTSNYDSDVFTPVIQEIAKKAGKSYGDDEKADIAMRVIADHIRAVSFGITDGASPSNDGRGYVIRRILRRAVRYGWDSLGLRKPFMFDLVPVLARQFKDVFPELHAQLNYVQNVIKSEEDSFLKTLGSGISMFEDIAKNTKVISGDDAFKLHDTYGFPIDLTHLMARERGLSVDEKRFSELMQEQKERARAAGRFAADASEKGEWIFVHGKESDITNTVFTGYDSVEEDAKILALRKSKNGAEIILDKTPFYAESGGQVADTGVLSDGDQHLAVKDVQKVDGRYVHFTSDIPENPDAVFRAAIDTARRTEIKKHHTATHLVHAALRQVLGTHVVQKGSLVNDEKLRFDFSHFEAVKPDQLDEIEQLVNTKIQENIPLTEERSVSLEEARNRGAMMLFGEKYGDKVRVITFDKSYSVELCGGTHVNYTGEIGYFRFTMETSVAAGIRRIEAVSGRKADEVLRNEKKLIAGIKSAAGASIDPVEYIVNLQNEKKQLEKALEKTKRESAVGALDKLISDAKSIEPGLNFVGGIVESGDMNSLKQLGYDALNQLEKETVIILGTSDKENGKVYLMAAVTEDLIKKGVKAGGLIGSLAKIVGGGGGGQPNLATAGGRIPEKLPEVFEKAPEVIKSMF